ncbi:cryptochrome/photolyase family protein [Ramlibacter albus]|uniref:Deoxyribodipyrimidine photo-lyase n=1 Tax=Ramlibacter albus TaxID=2079448 RepID=A0A923S0B7_9BURK|nr:deoxyribodipyrimidine photo-lyase [Ramlibacter albus]MBC5763174.1 deoxyribodipyrimidine photo-lyase [Ramlibacter albus]
MKTRALVWLRRDLRLADNAALAAALERCGEVYCAFVFDTDILDALPRNDRRVAFIRESLVQLDEAMGGKLAVRHGRAVEEIPRLAAELGVGAVYAARDYEPAAIARDDAVRTALAAQRIALEQVKDHVVFEPREVLTQAGTPYTVFTPYKNAWLKKLGTLDAGVHDVIPAQAGIQGVRGIRGVPPLADIGFEATDLRIPTGEQGARDLLEDFLKRIDRYDTTRDFPAVKGPSYLGTHLRFGTISIRELVRHARKRNSEGAKVWLSELCWRDFFFQILANFPHVVDGAFKRQYDAIEWEQDERLFRAWCDGRTGYPIVDAAMRQLNTTGYMHNRLRMVAASFLVKDLGIDWRRGERYFAEKLLDYELASNNGNWQWAASTGCDAQPWFRVFNPQNQQEKFDPQGKFIARYLPEGERIDPIVDHAQARERTLARYAAVRDAQ